MSKRRGAIATRADAGSVPRHLRALWGELKRRGWTWGWTSRTHIRLRHPSGRVVFAAGCTSDAEGVEKITRRKCRAVERAAGE